jgi:hypothetical protein
VSLINVAFRKAEGFLLDRDRIDLPAVRELLQKGKFLVAEDKFLCSCVYLEQRGDRSYLGLLFSQSATAELWPQLPVDDRCRSLLREGGQPLHGFANG